MRKRVPGAVTMVAIMLALLVLTTTSNARIYPGDDQGKPEPFIIKGVVSVRFEDDVDLRSVEKSFDKVRFGLASLDAVLDQVKVYDATKIFPWRTEKPPVNSGMHDLTRWYQFKFDETQNVSDVVDALLQNPNIRTAEAVWAQPVEAEPNDPEWGSQWAMNYPSTPDPLFYDAWDIETGSDSIKIAMTDTGVNYLHRDLIQNIWVNPGEDLDGDGIVYDEDDLDGIDNDGNGVIDDLIGYDFLSGLGSVWPGEDGGVRDSDPNDFNGHGTHCAGITAAANNNGLDVTGVAGGWYGGHRSFAGAKIICLRIGGTADDGHGYVNPSDAAAAIDYAAMMGAHVVNCSWGGSSAQSAAIDNAVAAGMTICHAAGNDDNEYPDFLDTRPGGDVLSIASTGPYSDAKSGFSNYGDWIDVSAPGSSILSTYSDEYVPMTASLSGTSMASPMVAGLAALIRSHMPSLNRDQIDSIIVNSADYDALYNANPIDLRNLLGSGRIDAYQALINLPNAKFTADVTDGPVPLTVQFTDLSPNSPTAWEWSFGNGDGSIEQNPQYTFNDVGVYTVSLKVDEGNPLGWGEEHLKNYVWVQGDTCIMDSVEASKGKSVAVPVYLRNTVLVKEIQFAFTYANDNGITYDSFSVEGLRTEYFESITKNAADPWHYGVSILMKTNTSGGSTYLTPGDGPILNLYFTAPRESDPEIVSIIDTATVSGKNPRMTTILGNYFPIFTPGKISIGPCAHGDADCNGQINVADLVLLVNYAFNEGPAPDPIGGDVDGSGQIDVADLVYLVNYAFNEGPAPPSM